MASPAGLSHITHPTEPLRGAIERFLGQAEAPALTEDGEGLFALAAGAYALDDTNGRLTIHAWDGAHSLTRRIVAIANETRGRLTLRVERFGKRFGTLTLIDLARPSTTKYHRQSARLELRESFRRFLRRWYSGSRLVELTTGASLTASLSPNFPRAFLRSGAEGWAAIAAPVDPLLADQALSFGLIWLDYLRRREIECAIRGLILWLPAGHERTTCLRLRYLNADSASCRVWVYTPCGLDHPVDLADYGNIDTEVEPCRGAPAHLVVTRGQPELRLEAQVRGAIRRIDPDLLPEPIYGQVPAFAATAHGLIDLLAADTTGRLSVIELKASEEIHLPMQALDYWMRVKWHVERGDFAGAGYFPGLSLSRQAPRLLLVAPALMFHPSNEIIVGYFSPEVPVERIGVGIEWQKDLKLLFSGPKAMSLKYLRNVKDALGWLKPHEVIERASRPVRVGLHADSDLAFFRMESWLMPAGWSTARRQEASQVLYRASETESPNGFDVEIWDADTPHPPDSITFSWHEPARTVRRVIHQHEGLMIPLARSLAPFRRPVSSHIIAKIARENAVFSIATALPDLVPLLSLPWAAGEFASDTAVLTANQIRMVFMLGAASNREVGYREQRNEIGSIVAGAFGWRALARELVGKIPLGGGLIPKAAIAWAGTQVVGQSLERYYRIGYGYTAAERREAWDRSIDRGKQIAATLLKHRGIKDGSEA